MLEKLNQQANRQGPGQTRIVVAGVTISEDPFPKWISTQLKQAAAIIGVDLKLTDMNLSYECRCTREEADQLEDWVKRFHAIDHPDVKHINCRKWPISDHTDGLDEY